MEHSMRPVKLGTQDRSVELNGFVLTETVRRPGQVLSRHYHAHTNIGLALGGAFVETIGSRAFEISPGSLTLLPAGEIHSDRYDQEEVRCLIIEVKPQRLQQIRQASTILESAAHFRNELVLSLTRRLQWEFRLHDTAAPLAIEALIMELLALGVRTFSNSRNDEPPGLQNARDIIHARFADNIGLSEIAKAAGMHPSHLAKIFRRQLRCTVGEYVRRVRLEYASQELSCSNKTLSEIALAAGFYDQSHFTHTFKLQHGLTPSAYRAAAQAGKKHTNQS
jgi:AraC family transcriptional regulator